MRLYLARKTVRMKKFLILYGFAVTLLLIGIWRRYGSENRRLLHNQRALMSEVGQYRTRADEAAASVEVLQLRCREFERLRAEDAQRIRQLGIRLRRVEAAAVSATQSAVVRPARAASSHRPRPLSTPAWEMSQPSLPG